MIVLMKYTVRQLLRKVKSCVNDVPSSSGQDKRFSFSKHGFDSRRDDLKNNLKFIKIFDIIYM